MALQTKPTTIDLMGGILCHACNNIYENKLMFDKHYRSQHSATKVIYTCTACSKQKDNYSNFRNHCYNNHVIQERFKCPTCPKYFNQQKRLKDHIRTAHKPEPMACLHPNCKQVFNKEIDLKMHQLTHKEGPPYTCQLCPKTLNNLKCCLAHCAEHTVSNFTCPICQEMNSDETAMASHILCHFGESTIKTVAVEIIQELLATEDVAVGIHCHICYRLYNFKKNFDQHFRNEHKGEQVTYSCNICGRQDKNYNEYRSHYINHRFQERFKCESCPKHFPRQRDLVIHTNYFHLHRGYDECKPFECELCHMKFETEKKAIFHRNNTHNITVAKCLEAGCQESFNTPEGFILHQLVHKQHPQNWCSKCGLFFKNAAECASHISAHKKCTYVCPICKIYKGFNEKRQLAKHILLHFESTLYRCETCNKSYKSKRSLLGHQMEHRVEKPYNCHVCSKGFVNSIKLKQHINIHTGQRPYACKFCDSTFTNLPNLIKHTKRMHNTESKTKGKEEKNNLKVGKRPQKETDTKSLSDVIDSNGIANKKKRTIPQDQDINTLGNESKSLWSLYNKDFNANVKEVTNYNNENFVLKKEYAENQGRKANFLSKQTINDDKPVEDDAPQIYSAGDLNLVVDDSFTAEKPDIMDDSSGYKSNTSPPCSALSNDSSLDSGVKILHEQSIIEIDNIENYLANVDDNDMQYLKDNFRLPGTLETTETDLEALCLELQDDLIGNNVAIKINESELNGSDAEVYSDTDFQNADNLGGTANKIHVDSVDFTMLGYIGNIDLEFSADGASSENRPVQYDLVSSTTKLPCEYGPDFIHLDEAVTENLTDLAVIQQSNKIIDFGDVSFPHIDPHLTIKESNLYDTDQYVKFANAEDVSEDSSKKYFSLTDVPFTADLGFNIDDKEINVKINTEMIKDKAVEINFINELHLNSEYINSNMQVCANDKTFVKINSDMSGLHFNVNGSSDDKYHKMKMFSENKMMPVRYY